MSKKQLVEKEKTGSGNIIDWRIIRRILSFVKPYRARFVIVIVLTILLGVLSPIRAKLIQYTMDEHIAHGKYHELLMMLLVLLSLLVMQSLFLYTHTYLSGWIGQQIIRDIRVKLYSHLIRFKLSFFDKTPIGRLVTRAISDVESLAAVFSEGLAAMAGDLLQIIFILIFMFWESWRLALLSLSTLPLMALSTYIFKEKIKVAFNDVRNAVANLNSFVQEHITGMAIVQLFGSEKSEMKKFEELNAEHRDSNLRSVLYYSIYFPVAEIIAAMGIGLLVWYGAKGIMDTENTGITVGMLTAFIMYIQMFFRPIRMLADRYNTLQMGIVSSSRIMTLLDDDSHLMPEGNKKWTSVKGLVEFKNVHFSYIENQPVLKNISFTVQPGQSLALVGATGAGKSSIISLLNRFYDIEQGDILLDGVNIREASLPELRKHIGVVMQDVFLFSNSIRENITLGDTSITDEQILSTAEKVGALKFIERLPNQLDYQVMERGASLSVGQRQLLSFIRAMVYNPAILILDEATASVDTETEQMIQEAIDKMLYQRTSIIIAHRLSTIQKADQIMVLDHGEIKESGTHQELLKQNGLYTQLYQMQYAHATPA